MNVLESSELVVYDCVDKKGIHFFTHDVSSRMRWQKLRLFILVQKRVFMTISGRIVLRTCCNVGKHFRCFEKFRIIIYDLCGNQNISTFIQNIPTFIVLTKKSICPCGAEMSFWVRMTPIPWQTSEEWSSQLTHPFLTIADAWQGQSF